MELQQELPFSGNEIWEYLQGLSVDELLRYDLRVEALYERVQNDILRAIPSARIKQFHYQFLKQHSSSQHQQPADETVFQKTLMLELRDTVVLAKNMLFDIVTKHDIYLGDNLPAPFRAEEINLAYYQSLKQLDEFIVISEIDSKILMKRLRAQNAHYQFYTHGENGKVNKRLALTSDNIHHFLAATGYTLDLKHRELGGFFRKINEIRLSLSDEVHERVFGIPKIAKGPFTINPQHAKELLYCRQNILTHEQTNLIWHSLTEKQRTELFDSDKEPTAVAPIILKRGVTHLHLLNAAAENHHNITLNIPQTKKLLSKLTLGQLCEMDKLSYHKAADAGRSALTSGSQNLGAYSVNTRNISQVLHILMGAAFKLSIYATAVTSLVVGSLVVGVAAAIIQYHQNTQREERFRLSHITHSLAVNRKRQEIMNTLAHLAHEGLTHARNGQTRFDQLVSMLENAGLKREFKQSIQQSRKSGPVKHALNPPDKQLNQVYQINSLTHFLQLDRDKIEAHYLHLEKLRSESTILTEKLDLARQMKETDNLLRFIETTRRASPIPVIQEQIVIPSTPQDNTFGTKRKIGIQRGWNRTKQYFKSKQKTLRPLANGAAATIIVSLSLIAAIMLLASGVGTIVGLSIIAVAIGVILGIASYKTVQRVQMMEQVQVDDAQAMNTETQHAEQIKPFQSATQALQQIELQQNISYRANPSKGKEEQNAISEKRLEVEDRLIAENQQIRKENAILKERMIQMQAELSAYKRADTPKPSALRKYSFLKTSRNFEHQPDEGSNPALVIN